MSSQTFEADRSNPGDRDHLISAEELTRMRDVDCAELVNGKVVPMAPTGYAHGRLEGILAGLLFVYLQQQRLGHVLPGEVGIFTRRNPDTVRAADIVFISTERYAAIQSESYLDVCPELIVEVMSPRDTWSDVQEKLAEYFAIDARMIWVVDPRLEQIHVFHSLDRVIRLTKGDVLSGGELLPGFQVAVREIFEQS